MTLRQLQFMESFVEDLLNLHMINQGVFVLSEEEFDPDEAISFVCDMVSLKAEQKRVDIKVKVMKHLPAIDDELLNPF